MWSAGRRKNVSNTAKYRIQLTSYVSSYLARRISPSRCSLEGGFQFQRSLTRSCFVEPFRVNALALRAWKLPGTGYLEEHSATRFPDVSVYHGGGSADAESVALKHNSERRNIMVKRKTHRNAESASAGELGRELR